MTQDKLVQKYRNKINTIINKLTKVKLENGIYENFGQAELRAFEDSLNKEYNLQYSNFAMLMNEINGKIDNF